MSTVDIVIGIVLIVVSLFLIIAVLMQHGKAHNLSGTIAGGAESFFGKSKGQTIDKKLSTVTTIIAIVFVIIVLAFYLMQDSTDTSGQHSTYTEPAVTTTAPAATEHTHASETAAPAVSVSETAAPESEAPATVVETAAESVAA